MKGLLLTSSQDINKLNNDKNLSGIACSYSIIQMNKEIKLDYLFESCLDDNLDSLVGEIAANWYRDSLGRDVISKHDVMLGAILQTHLTVKLSNVVRYYFALKKYSKKYKKILVSENIPNDLSLVAGLFSNNIDFFNSDNPPNLDSGEAKWVMIEPPHINKLLSKPLRILQMFFRKFLQNKVLIFNDWTFRKLDNPNCLNINDFNPIRAFCLIKSSKYLQFAKKNFPTKLDFNLIKINLHRLLNASNLDKNIKDDMASLFIKVIEREYELSRLNLVQTYCSYREMFSFYSPSMVISSGYSSSFHQIIFGIAKSMKIPTLLVQDGQTFYFNKYNYPKDRIGMGQSFDYCALMGNDAKVVYDNVFSELTTNTLIISSPVISTFKFNYQKFKPNKVLIMFPHCMIYNPSCIEDQRYKYVIDVCELLTNLGFSEIQIKFKKGSIQQDQQKNIDYLKFFLDGIEHSNVEFVFGDLSQYLQTSKMIVGYLGTAIVESVNAKVPFYIYEPRAMGMSDEFIRNSTIFDEEQVSRNVTDLRQAIINKDSVSLNKDIFDNTHINDINFLEIIKNHKLQDRN